jgi:hypothetical protein
VPQGISSHGTIISILPPGETDWVEIAELGDIGGLGFTKNEFDITSHNRNIDTWVLGVLRRQPMTFPVFFNRAIAAHVLLQDAQLDNDPTTNMTYGFKVEHTDEGVLIFSGGVREMAESAPVDGVKTANVTVRATGEFILDGEVYGL